MCGIIYGRLPPEIKIKMAAEFNKRAYKYLVATDAIGLGLNLNIKRIVFTSLMKRTRSGTHEMIEPSHLRQIAGRAGRLEKEGGFVAAFGIGQIHSIKKALKGVNDKLQDNLDNLDLSYHVSQNRKIQEDLEVIVDETVKIESADFMAAENRRLMGEAGNRFDAMQFTKNQKEIGQAVIFPSLHHLDEFNKNLQVLQAEEIPFHELVMKFNEISKIGGMYVLQNFEDFYLVLSAYSLDCSAYQRSKTLPL